MVPTGTRVVCIGDAIVGHPRATADLTEWHPPARIAVAGGA